MTLREKLSAFAKEDRLPHGILLTGSDGAVAEAAVFAAKLYVCENKGDCGGCAHCRKIDGKTHPDVIHVRDIMRDDGNKPDGKYRIKQLRGIIAGSAVLPNDGDTRVYIVAGADTMNEHCQNALLKIIEEPRDFNRFVFTAGDTSAVLPTVLSRLVQLPADGGDDCNHSGNNGGEALETVKAIARALTVKSEYATAAAFSGIKDRAAFAEVLPLLLTVIRDATAFTTGYDAAVSPCPAEARSLAEAAGLGGLNKAAETLNGFMARIEQNPNVNIAASACAGRLFSAIFERN